MNACGEKTVLIPSAQRSGQSRDAMAVAASYGLHASPA